MEVVFSPIRGKMFQFSFFFFQRFFSGKKLVAPQKNQVAGLYGCMDPWDPSTLDEIMRFSHGPTWGETSDIGKKNRRKQQCWLEDVDR